MKFSELNFHARLSGHQGRQAFAFFPNGYGVSIITGEGAYTSGRDQYEVAVIIGTSANDWGFSNDTPITDDVVGHQTEEDVTRLLGAVENLPKYVNPALKGMN